MRLEKAYLFWGNYIFPFIAFPLLTWLWYREAGLQFTILAMGLPVVFGYVIPGIGTNILKKWRFRGPLTVGDFLIHQGFIYGSTMGLTLYLSFFPVRDNEPLALLGNIARTAIGLAFIGWSYDTLAVRHGLIEIYNEPWRRGAGPEAIVTYSAPLCYSVLGAVYAGIASWGYYILVQQGDSNSLWWLFLLGFLIISVTSTVPYLILERG